MSGVRSNQWISGKRRCQVGLFFGEVAGVDFDLLDGVVEREFAAEMPRSFRHSRRPGGLVGDAAGVGEEGGDLVAEACVDHAFDSEVDAVGEVGFSQRRAMKTHS